MSSFDFKSGCSIHIEYTPKDLGELRTVCSILNQYQGSFNISGDVKKGGNGNGNGSGKPILAKETLDELFDLARDRKVYLKKMVRDRFRKEIRDLYGGEAEEIKQELLTY